jgi:hypothetical protein
VLSFVLCLFAQAFLEMTAGIGSFAVDMIETLAGGRSSPSSVPTTSKLAGPLRMVVYLGVIIAAIVLATTGMSSYANICAIFGGLALGLALVKLLAR